MPFLNSKTGKTHRRLTSFVVLFREFYSERVNNFPSITLEGRIQSTLTINNDEPEWWLIDEKLLFKFGDFKVGGAGIQGKIDWLVWLEVTNELLLGCGAFFHNFTTEEDETVLRGSLIELESFPR